MVAVPFNNVLPLSAMLFNNYPCKYLGLDRLPWALPRFALARLRHPESPRFSSRRQDLIRSNSHRLQRQDFLRQLRGQRIAQPLERLPGVLVDHPQLLGRELRNPAAYLAIADKAAANRGLHRL